MDSSAFNDYDGGVVIGLGAAAFSGFLVGLLVTYIF